MCFIFYFFFRSEFDGEQLLRGKKYRYVVFINKKEVKVMMRSVLIMEGILCFRKLLINVCYVNVVNEFYVNKIGQLMVEYV